MGYVEPLPLFMCEGLRTTLESCFLLPCGAEGSPSQVVRIGGKHLYVFSCLSGPTVYLYNYVLLTLLQEFKSRRGDLKSMRGWDLAQLMKCACYLQGMCISSMLVLCQFL